MGVGNRSIPKEAASKFDRVSAFTSLLAVTLLAAAPRSYAPIRVPDQQMLRAVGFSFDSGDRVTFNLSHAAVLRSIEFRVAGVSYLAPLAGCPILGEVRFDTVRFITFPHEREQGTFTLVFRVGNEKDRQFGELPLFGVLFRDGRLADYQFTRSTAPNAGFTTRPCGPAAD